jgi:hypothetical protein
VRSSRRRRVTPCVAVRQDLCRLAVGAPATLGAARMAGHARRCPACAGFADDVARVRGWLADEGSAPRVTPRTGARKALVRELAARLARDLYARAVGAPVRPVGKRRADRARLVALLGPRALNAAPWRGVLPLLAARSGSSGDEAGQAPGNREQLLAAAVRLDPLGLDIVLGHLAQLERSGRRDQAHAQADGLLARLR